MAISFEELCNYIRKQIDKKHKGTTKVVKTALGLTDRFDLNNLTKQTFTSGISKVTANTSTLAYAGILIEIVIFYVKNRKCQLKPLSALTKYIERLKNNKFALTDTVKILNNLGLEGSDFYKTITDKTAHINICKFANGLLKQVKIAEKIKGDSSIDDTIQKVDAEAEVKDTNLDANDLEEFLQILANIKATCKDETIGDASTFIGELQLLLPEPPIEKLEKEIEYLRIVIGDKREESELTQKLKSCHPELRRKLVSAKTKIEKRIDALNAPSQTDLLKSPEGNDRHMTMDLNAIRAAQRKNLALARQINTAYHEACKQCKTDSIDDIVKLILENLKGTINSGETLTYYAGIQKSDIEDFPYLKIIDCKKREQKLEDTIKNYTKYMQGNTEAIAERDSIIMCVMSKNIKEPVVFTEKSWGYDIKYKKYIESILFSKQELFPCTIIPVSNSNSINDSYDPEALKNAEKKICALADDLNSIFKSSGSEGKPDKVQLLKGAYNKRTKQRKLRFCEGYIYDDGGKYGSFQTTNIYESTENEVLKHYADWGCKATPDQKLMIATFIISSIVPRVAFVNDLQTKNFINNVVFRLYNPLTDEQRKQHGETFYKVMSLARELDEKLKNIKRKIDFNKNQASPYLTNNSVTEAQKSKAEEALTKLDSFDKRYSEFSQQVNNFLANAQSSEELAKILKYLDEWEEYFRKIDKWITEKGKEIDTLISLTAFAQQTGYTAWKQGTKPTIGSYRVAGQQPAASAQAQTQPQPTQNQQQLPYPVPQMPQQQTYPPVNPTIQQQARSPIYQNYAQQPLPTQSQIAQQPPGGQPQYVQSSEQPQPYFQQTHTQQTTNPQYPQNPYYPQAQPYPNYQQQMYYMNRNQAPQQQTYQIPQKGQPASQPYDAKITQNDSKEKAITDHKNLQQKLSKLYEQVDKAKSNVTELVELINRLSKSKNLSTKQRAYLYSTGDYLNKKLKELETTYEAGKKYDEQSKTVKIYFTDDPNEIAAALRTIEQADSWVTQSLVGLEKFKGDLKGIEDTLNKNYQSLPNEETHQTEQQNQGKTEAKEEAKPEEAEHENGTEEPKVEEPKPEEGKTEEKKAEEEIKAEEKKAEEKKAEEKPAEEVKPEEEGEAGEEDKRERNGKDN